MNDDIKRHQDGQKKILMNELSSVKEGVENTLMKDVGEISKDYKLNIKIFDKTFLPLFGGGIADPDERNRYMKHWVSFVKLPHREVYLINDDGKTILKVPSLIDPLMINIPSVDETFKYSTNNLLSEAVLKYNNGVKNGPGQATEEINNDIKNVISKMTVENTDRKKDIDKLVMRYKALKAGKIINDEYKTTSEEETYDELLVNF